MNKGFTLLEILVALAIAAGSLVLVTAAVAGSLKRSAGAEVDARLERAAESRLAEWTSGLEAQREGALAGFDGHRWELRTSPEPGVLSRLKRVTLAVYGPGGAKVLERSELLHGPPGPR
ncbi:MAG TPA: prepilin-type N-terminal cleavage/methylation domain-containing protein [Planctomycetota bacterium]